MDIMQLMYIIISTYMIVAVYSFVWKENIFFVSTEGIIMAAGQAALIVTSYSNLKSNFSEMIGGHWTLIIPFILGIMLFTQLFPKYRWGARYGNAALMGVGMGLAIGLTIRAQILNIILSNVTTLINSPDAFSLFSNLVLFLAILTSMTYFIYGIPYTDTKGRVLQRVARIGRIALMASLGWSFVAHTTSDMDSFVASIVFIKENLYSLFGLA